jgi:hypothetical protein
MQEIITVDDNGEIIEEVKTASLAVTLHQAEITQRVATAHQFPRSLKLVQNRITSMATLDEESAEECVYALPRAGKPVTGPSIRFAEILKQSYGNCETGARVVHVDRTEMFVEAEGVFIDWETNSKTTSRVRRRISGKNGKIFSDDMIIVTGNAACAIAMRNAILAGVPKPLWRRAYDMVQQTIAGTEKTLVERRGAAMKALAAFGLKPEQICAAIGRASVEDITVDDVLILRGTWSALKNGETTVEEVLGINAAPPSQGTMAERYKPTEKIEEQKQDSAALSPPPAEEGSPADPPPTEPEAGLPLLTTEELEVLRRYTQALQASLDATRADPTDLRLKVLKKASDVFKFDTFKDASPALLAEAERIFRNVQTAMKS